MLEAIEKLLILQDRDQHILRVKGELARIDPERQSLTQLAAAAQAGLDAVKLKLKQIESERKKLELDAEAKQQQIIRYSNQQLQTKKNEEYRALAHEIEMCKEVIRKLEDQQIELMEQTEAAQKQAVIAAQAATEAKKVLDGRMADLNGREQNLRRELAELEVNRQKFLLNVEDGARSRYERLLKNKGATAVVGIEHGVCGGCHMQLPMQVVVSCRAQQEIVTCANCGRILYFTPEMDLVVAD